MWASHVKRNTDCKHVDHLPCLLGTSLLLNLEYDCDVVHCNLSRGGGGGGGGEGGALFVNAGCSFICFLL